MQIFHWDRKHFERSCLQQESYLETVLSVAYKHLKHIFSDQYHIFDIDNNWTHFRCFKSIIERF